MIVLKPIATVQTIVVYARNHDSTKAYSGIITPEETDTPETKTGTLTSFTDGVLTIKFTYGFQEARFYTISIISETVTIYKGKIFVTAQTSKFNPVLNDYLEEPNVNSGWVVKT